jgi:hypothetical protein
MTASIRAQSSLPTGVTVALLALFTLLPATSALAQLKGSFTVGLGINKIYPQDEELSTNARFGLSFGRIPTHGLGLTGAFNWYDADIAPGPFDGEGRIGEVAVRPLMLGIGYTFVAGRFGATPSIVAGPSFNKMSIDDARRDRYSVEGSSFERKVGVVSLAVRPGLNLTYAVAPRFGLAGFAGYLFNRPKFDVRTPTGTVETTWKTDGFVTSAGIVVALF